MEGEGRMPSSLHGRCVAVRYKVYRRSLANTLKAALKFLAYALRSSSSRA